MPQVEIKIAQTNFTSGVLSPKLYGRTELAQYSNGLKELVNYGIMPQGGIERRPGTKFVNEVKTSSKKTRLIPFVFSTEQAYVLEFGDLYIRFYTDEGILTTPPPIELVSPYDEDDLAEISYTQSADVLYLFHPNYQPRKLTRTTPTSFTISLFEANDGAFLGENLGTTTVTPSATTGNITITASVALFAATDVGRLIRIKHSNKWGCAKITAFASSTSVSATVQTNHFLFGTTAVTAWRLGAWSDTLGWPHTGTFHENRLFLGRTNTYPQDIWATTTGAFETFSPTKRIGAGDDTITDDSGFSYRLSTDKVNAITSLVSGKALHIGTTDSEFSLVGSSIDEAITPTNAQVRRETTQGSIKHNPVKVGSAVIFIHRTKQKLLEYKFVFDSDQYDTSDLSLLAEHYFKPDSAEELVYQQFPNELIWARLATGELIAITYLVREKVLAFAKHIIGGNGIVKSLVSIPSADGTFDQLWMIVQRTINGDVKQYVETMQNWFYPTGVQDKDNCFFLDCGLTYDGVPADVISGLDHLEGEEVSVLADGANHPNKTVVSGEITLDREASVVQVGYSCPAYGETLPLDMPEGNTSQITNEKRIKKVGIRLHNSLGLSIGDRVLEDIPFRDSSMPMGSSPDLFSGLKKIPFNGRNDELVTVRWRQDDPLPSTILAMYFETLVQTHSGGQQ